MPSYASYGDWLSDLVSTEAGRIWLSKFEYDLYNGNLPPETERNFIVTIESNLGEITPLLSAISVVDFIVMQDSDSFSLQGLRIPVKCEPYSCVLRVEVFALYYLKRRVFPTILDEGDDEVDFVWENLGGLIGPRFYDGWLQTERDFFWCTPTDKLDAIATRVIRENKAATIVRTRLGMHLMHKGRRMIRIDISPYLLDGKRMCAPNTLDAGTNPMFIPCKDADGYGRTMNLRTIKRDLKELVCEKIAFTEEFVVKKIGKVGAGIPSIDWDKVRNLVAIPETPGGHESGDEA